MALPAHAPHQLPYGLCVFGLAYACGITWGGAVHANPAPLTSRDVIDLAAEHQLSWVELPMRMLGDTPEALRALRSHAEERGVRFIVAGQFARAEDLLPALQAAAELDAPTVRCILSSLLCGDRRGFPGGWRAHMERSAQEIEEVLPDAERLGIAIAVENHQDADSEDLLRLCRRFESRYVGVTLDCGNPLAVMEDPVRFAQRLGPYLRHAHFKDYTVHPAPNGFRLVRAALGDGVVDFAGIKQVLDAQEQPVTRSIEMAALNARQIPMLEPSWWDEFGDRGLKDALPALSVVIPHLRPADEDWRTPLERNASGAELLAYEMEQLQRSVAHLRRLGA